MIGSPERVKIQRSLVQNLSKIQHLKIIGRFLTFWGVKIPRGGHNKFWGQNNINKPAMLGSLGSKEILTKLNKMQLLTKFQNNLMDRSQVIQLNPS